MADVIFVAAIVAFFVLSALYVVWCDRILGPDEFAAQQSDIEDVVEPLEVAA